MYVCVRERERERERKHRTDRWTILTWALCLTSASLIATHSHILTLSISHSLHLFIYLSVYLSIYLSKFIYLSLTHSLTFSGDRVWATRRSQPDRCTGAFALHLARLTLTGTEAQGFAANVYIYIYFYVYAYIYIEHLCSPFPIGVC